MDKLIYAFLSVTEGHDKANLLPAGMKGIAGVDLQTVYFEDISAVFSDIQRGELVSDKSNAMAYAGVVEALSLHFTLLPVRFGSLIATTDAITKIMERNYNEIQSNLRKVENKVEFGLKIFCDSEKIKGELRAKTEAEQPSEPLQHTEHSIYRDYLNKKLKEHRFEELLLAHVDMIIQDITTHLAQLNPLHKFKKMMTETNIIDAFFLLEKNKNDGLINAVKELQNRYDGLHFMLTGPWPPYNFVDITIK